MNKVDPRAGEAFNGAMTEGSRLQGLLVVDAYDFSGVTSVCDVGGGTGAVMGDVLAANPALRGIVFDLPQLAEPARRHLAARGVGDRGEFVAGDFFESVPEGPAPSFAKVMDLEMLILTGSGRERTSAEYERLFAGAGFRVERRILLPSLFTVFELARA